MRLLFYEKQQQSYFWKVLGSQDDKVPRTVPLYMLPLVTVSFPLFQVCWEEWIIPIMVVPAVPQRDLDRRRLVAEQLQERMQFILKTVTDKKEHIPPVPKELTGTTTFYHEIKVVKEAKNTMAQAVKGMSSAKII
jgi:hypothetical protein